MPRPPVPEWFRTAQLYQIYPQSFCDTNHDGIGDLPGVVSKLDYLKGLGVNAVWLSPCFDSPFGDAGYDVRDFYKIAPRYGTNDDFKRLCAEAHRKGMRVLLDLVAGHTSVECAWFQASAKPEKNRHTNWYVWTDNAWTGPADAVKGYSDRDGRYVPNFFWFQPALNYGTAKVEAPWQLPQTHPDVKAVRAELMNIMRFWLKLGCDGFRVDMASSLVKNDADKKETIKLWQGYRAALEKEFPEAVLISEWSFPKQALAGGFHADFMIHFGTPAYDKLFRDEIERDVFRIADRKRSATIFDRKGKGDIREFLDIYLDHYAATKDKGYISLPSGNHDIGRLATGRTKDELEVCYAFLYSMPGLPVLYYGDEIGMRTVPGLASKEGGYGRTGARTPMHWTRGKNAGFSNAEPEKLYLPIDPDAHRPTVEDQEKDPASLLHFIRKMAALRRAHKALEADGEFTVLYAKKKQFPFAYLRTAGKEKILVAVNPSPKATRVKLQGKGFAHAPHALAAKGATSLKRQGHDLILTMPALSWGFFEV